MRSAVWIGSRPLSLPRLVLWVLLSSLPLLWLLGHRLGHIPLSGSRRLHHNHGLDNDTNIVVEHYSNKNNNNPIERRRPSPSLGSGRPERTHTLILTTFRSGSSFLGQLFNRHPDVFYLSEPAWHVWDARPVEQTPGILERQAEVTSLLGSLFQCRTEALGPYLKPAPNRPQQPAEHRRGRDGRGADGENEGERAVRSATLSQLFQFSDSRALCVPPACNASAAGRGPRGTGETPSVGCIRACGAERLEPGMREACAARRHAVIKETRLVQVAPLRALMEEPALRLRVVHLVRDPRAVHLSRARAFQDHHSDLRVMKIVCDANHNISMSMRGRGNIFAGGAGGGDSDSGGGGPGGGYDDTGDGSWDGIEPALLRGRYALVRYEDLVRQPAVALSRLFRFVGIRSDPQLLSFALNMTRGAELDAPTFSVRPRDALRVSSRWRQNMSFESVSMVQQACSSMMASYGYRAMGSADEMRDMKVPSTSPLGDARG